MFPRSIVTKARTSAFYRWLLNLGLFRMIPFNKPHGFRVHALSEYGVTAVMPYRRRNMNHIRGLHACGLATLTEFTSGLALILQLDSSQYRIILKRLEMDYLYQGKMDAYASFEVTPEWLESNVKQPLSSSDAVVIPCKVEIKDVAGNHLTTGIVHWQVKPWSKVKTKA